MLAITEKDGSVTFKVRVQPRATRTEIAGSHDDSMKLRLAAVPVDGKANEECRRFLAKTLGVALGTVEILTGESSRQKVIRVHGVTAAEVRRKLGDR